MTGQVQEHGDKFGCLLANMGRSDLLKTKQLLELVHHDEQVGLVAVKGHLGLMDKCLRALTPHRFQQALDGFGGPAVAGHGKHRSGEIAEGRPTGLENGYFPKIPILDQETGFEVGNEPRAHQGGLAGPGAPHHGHKSVGVELLQEGASLLPAPEIVEAVRAFKGPQADKGVLHGDVLIHRATPASRSLAVIWGSMLSEWLLSRILT